MRARSCSSLALAAGVLAASAGCGGGTSNHAASGLSGCAAPAQATHVLWSTRSSPLYFLDGRKVLSTRGRVASLATGATALGLWACRPPVLVYSRRGTVSLVALGTHKPVPIGAQTVIAPDGRFVSIHGQTIRYAGGPTVRARGLRQGWRLASVAASPRHPLDFLAETEAITVGIDECSRALGTLQRVTPRSTTGLLVYNPCHENPRAAWSPDGSRIALLVGYGSDLYLSDSTGRGLRRLTTAGGVTGFLWSPDGKRIAYSRGSSVSVVNVSTGSIRRVGAGRLEGWSPNSRAIAIASRTQLQACPVAGGRPRTLLRLS